MVKLFAYSASENNLSLVYEYCDKGSLDKMLSNESGRRELNWQRRLLIARDISHTLHYLHTHSAPMFHRDVKSANIALTEAYDANLIDFGFAKFDEQVKCEIEGTKYEKSSSQGRYGTQRE